MSSTRPLALRQLLSQALGFVRDNEIRRFVLFLFVGSLNFIFYYSMFALLHYLGEEPTAAVITATILGVLFNFLTTGRIVFGSNRARLLPRFLGVYAVQLSLNVLSLRTLVAAGMPVLLAEALVVVVLAVLTFFALRYFVFTSANMGAAGAASRDAQVDPEHATAGQVEEVRQRP